tara:strand:- start:471 stop:638 length:168 start_codon:yes stop_codon:yes gene_type:complete
MKCIIKNRLFEDIEEKCFFLMAMVHRRELKLTGLWWKEDEKKFQKEWGHKYNEHG